VARRPVAKRETFTVETLAAKRPGTGVSPMHYWELLGEPASRDYAADETIDEKLTGFKA
jgi:N-acetylneuraminate synthase